jgi:hypothetical protein
LSNISQFKLVRVNKPIKTTSHPLKTKPKSPKPPHKVDEKLGFADHLLYIIGLDSDFSGSYGRDFDKMMIGRIEDGKRYLGNGCHQKIETR